ncbi:MAG TPA: NAD(P)/FAD-dependent oxidoreductase [Myxococcales bacterium]|nr:NAD(P)/FAD-dependent oxidoreductase [Myxococcales bacterium]
MKDLQGVDVLVVGAGVVGLASASALARSGRSVLVVERHAGIAREVTSRNSQVIHAGIYAPPESLKASLCVRGRELLYDWLSERRVACRKLGKLVVAVEEAEMAGLETLLAQGRASGVPGLEILDARAAKRREPRVAGIGALYSPETGILDASGFALSLLADAQTHGADLLLRHEVVSMGLHPSGWRVGVRSPGADSVQTVDCEVVVNAAGLASDGVAEMAGLDLDARCYRQQPCKGSYFALRRPEDLDLQHLVYPAPPASSGLGGGGLGIHVTRDWLGEVRLGPDAEYVGEHDFRVEATKAGQFAEAARRYLPGIRADWLVPDFAGIRPKLAGAGEGFRDFVIREESESGHPGLINCIGVESPGLTAALAIGERVASQAQGN